jgi:hypothetical protein
VTRGILAGMSRRSIVVAGVAFASLLSASSARADVRACIEASEKGQKSRKEGRLREARDQFVICQAEGCPAIVKHDCAQWTSEVSQVLPTIVLGAKDSKGRDLFDVIVSMDGEPLVKKLDGKAVTVDPGKHTFKFETGGLVAEKTALVKEGERARLVDVTFAPGREVEPPPPPPPPPPAARKEHTIYPWLVVGAGAAAVGVGAFVFFTAPSRPSNCDAERKVCVATAGQSPESLAEDRDRASTSDTQPKIGLIIGGIGLAVAAGGLAWHFLEPTGGSTGGLRVTPWMTGQAGGLGIAGHL